MLCGTMQAILQFAIVPVGISRLNEINLALPIPSFERLFSSDCRADIEACLDVAERRDL
jgi:hypothetical protein